MIDNGTQLTNLGMQLNNISSQIQKISMDLSFINNNYSIQLQNIGMQISNFSQQIYNIGMLIKNTNSIQQPFQMGNMMNNIMKMINLNNDNIGMNINNDKFYQEPNEKIIHIVFHLQNSGKTVINISVNKTIKELLNLYKEKIGEDSDFLRKNRFIIDGKRINPNDNITIYDFGIKLGTNMNGKIILVDPLNNFFLNSSSN